MVRARFSTQSSPRRTFPGSSAAKLSSKIRTSARAWLGRRRRRGILDTALGQVNAGLVPKATYVIGPVRGAKKKDGG